MGKRQPKLTAEVLIEQYLQGAPAWGTNGEKGYEFIADPSHFVLGIHDLKVPKSVKRDILKRKPYEVTVNQAFKDVVESCAVAKCEPGDEDYWLNGAIRTGFLELHEKGYAHSVECWSGDELAGGLYGLAIGRVFFSESMFYFNDGAGKKYDGAGKQALVHLTARLWKAGFTIHDSQSHSDYLTEFFGLQEVDMAAFLPVIQEEAKKPANFLLTPDIVESELVAEYFANRETTPVIEPVAVPTKALELKP